MDVGISDHAALVFKNRSQFFRFDVVRVQRPAGIVVIRFMIDAVGIISEIGVPVLVHVFASAENNLVRKNGFDKCVQQTRENGSLNISVRGGVGKDHNLFRAGVGASVVG